MSLSDALVPLEPDDQELPELCWQMRLQGLTNKQIARRLLISVPDVVAQLDLILPTLDHKYRQQAISEALLTLDQLAGLHMQRAANDVESASIVIRCLTEKRSWAGITPGTDPVQVSIAAKAASGETSMSCFGRGLAWMKQFEQLDGDVGGRKPEGDGEPVAINPATESNDPHAPQDARGSDAPPEDRSAPDPTSEAPSPEPDHDT